MGTEPTEIQAGQIRAGDMFEYGGRNYMAVKLSPDHTEIRIQFEENSSSRLCLRPDTKVKLVNRPDGG